MPDTLSYYQEHAQEMMLLDFRRIRRIPMDQALKDMEQETRIKEAAG